MWMHPRAIGNRRSRNMLRYFFFDLDDTLTPSRTRMLPEHEGHFGALCERAEVIVVSGAEENQMRAQIPDTFNGMYYLLTENGNHAVHKKGTELWSEGFSPEQKAIVGRFIDTIHDELALPVSDENDLVEDRGSQISYSLIGHHEALEKKRAFDADGSKRKAILAAHPELVQNLEDAGVEVTVGGTTCFDIYLKGRNKGFNVKRLIDHLGWQHEHAIYIGDALEPGRNDESVIGVIATKKVRDHPDTFSFIKSLLH